MRFFGKLVIALVALAMPAIAQAPTELQPKAPLGPTHQVSTAQPTPPAGAAALTKADVDAWLDGFMPYAMASSDIPGGVVTVVKNGQVLTARGFGYADKKAGKRVDPDETLFRPGSVSKLFTWTAVMQLVQAGKIDLDRDINDYLDFRIPPAFGKPVTLRNLMTHTAGFEETAKYLITSDPKIVLPLDKTLKRWVPSRIYAPGEVPAYSNYGASLAGYIVQRVSGEPFEAYVERHIFAPIGMTRSSFRQPLPSTLANGMAKAYQAGSDDTKKFEIIPMSPAGGLSATGDDMAKFMIAHLAQGGPLLNPATARLMYTPQASAIPGLPPMALGFYHEDRNGQTIIGHGGDTVYFHSDLHLWLDQGVGLFVSFNSEGKEGAAHVIRSRLLQEFTDRYFPAAPANLPTATTAKAHGAAMVGHYANSRGSTTNWLKLIGLVGQSKVTLNPDNTISVSSFTDTAHNPKKWREVGPWQWQEVGGTARLHAATRDGKVIAFTSTDLPLVFVSRPVGFFFNAGWIIPVLAIALGISLLTALAWPVTALVRRSYGYNAPLAGRPLLLHRLTRATAWLMVVIALGWVVIISAISNDLELFNGGLDIWMRLLQLLTLVAAIGALIACWNAYAAYRAPDRRWWRYGGAALFALSALFLTWFAFAMKLVTPSLNF